jgi:hypothetical protein
MAIGTWPKTKNQQLIANSQQPGADIEQSFLKNLIIKLARGTY